MKEAELRARLKAVWGLQTVLLRILGKLPRQLILDYGVWDYLENHMERIGELIRCRVVLPAVFDSDACRFTSELELEFNEYVLDFESPQVHEYAFGEFPIGEVRHLLNLRGYERLCSLPREIVGGIIGYLAGDIREFYANLLAIVEQYTSWDICLGLREDGWDDNESIKEAEVMVDRLNTYIMIYDALVATLPPPFA